MSNSDQQPCISTIGQGITKTRIIGMAPDMRLILCRKEGALIYRFPHSDAASAWRDWVTGADDRRLEREFAAFAAQHKGGVK